jgi:hypothetical protein
MIYENMKELFEDRNDEFLKFDRVQNKRSNRADLHAFLLLDSLLPGDDDVVASAEHDEIFLSYGPRDLAAAATEEQIIELIRCGVRLDTNWESLAMFV